MTTVTVGLTPVELTLLAAAVNEKIAWLDAEIARLRGQADEADAWSMLFEAEDTNRLMRLTYAGIIRRIEQALDVPFVDNEEAVRVAVVGVHRPSVCMSPTSHDEWMSDHRACGCDGIPVLTLR